MSKEKEQGTVACVIMSQHETRQQRAPSLWSQLPEERGHWKLGVLSVLAHYSVSIQWIIHLIANTFQFCNTKNRWRHPSVISTLKYPRVTYSGFTSLPGQEQCLPEVAVDSAGDHSFSESFSRSPHHFWTPWPRSHGCSVNLQIWSIFHLLVLRKMPSD